MRVVAGCLSSISGGYEPQGALLEGLVGHPRKDWIEGRRFLGQVVLARVPLVFMLGSLCNLQVGIYEGSIEFFLWYNSSVLTAENMSD